MQYTALMEALHFKCRVDSGKPVVESAPLSERVASTIAAAIYERYNPDLTDVGQIMEAISALMRIEQEVHKILEKALKLKMEMSNERKPH